MKLHRWRRAHRILGIILLLPILAWAATGFFFFLKPGYKAAYGSLSLKFYPLQPSDLPTVQDNWLEYRVVRTLLGPHLIVRTAAGVTQLDWATLKPGPEPDAGQVRLLIEEAIQVDPERYGAIERIEGTTIYTDSGVKIELNWSTLSLYQYGPDTGFIDTVYDIHYLRWTGIKEVDRVAGVVGLALLLLMTVTGLILLFSAGTGSKNNRSTGAGD